MTIFLYPISVCTHHLPALIHKSSALAQNYIWTLVRIFKECMSIPVPEIHFSDKCLPLCILFIAAPFNLVCSLHQDFSYVGPILLCFGKQDYMESKIFRVLSGYELRSYPTSGWDGDTYQPSYPHTLVSSKETSGLWDKIPLQNTVRCPRSTRWNPQGVLKMSLGDRRCWSSALPTKILHFSRSFSGLRTGMK